MKTKLISILFLFIVGLNVNYAQKKQPDSPDYRITLKTDKYEYSLGEPIYVTVEYYNGADAAWKLYRPDSSFYNSIHYRNILWWVESEWSGYAFNKSMFINEDPDCPECGFAIALTGGTIQLQPKEKYSFITEIMEGQKDHIWILPGKYLIEYYDGYEAIQSDTIEISIKFTEQSVDLLLKRLLDEKQNRSNIEWVIKLFADIYPDIKKYQYTYKNYTITYEDSQIEFNRKLIEEFLSYWRKIKGTEIMEEKLQKINTDFSKYYFMKGYFKHIK